MNDDAKAREEQKRERCWVPRERWRILQETIAWVDSQQKIPRNSVKACLAEESRLLAPRNYRAEALATPRLGLIPRAKE